MRASYPIAARSIPNQGSLALPETFDFSLAGSFLFDLYQEMEGGALDFIQAAFIDNSLNAQAVTIKFPSITAEDGKIICPPQSQGLFPINAQMGKFQATISSTGNVKVPVTFYNVEMPYVVWPVTALSVPAASYAATFTKKSIVLSGGNDLVMAANPLRKGHIMEGPSANGASVFVQLDGTAATGTFVDYEIQPGGNYPAYLPFSLLDINAFGTAGQHLTAWELT